jgi:hypothetical protein
MNTLKKCQVVMLSTNEKAKKGQLVINEELPKDKLFIAWIDAQRSLGQHLYILSDDEIKEGDWCLFKQIIGSEYKLCKITYKFGNQLTSLLENGNKQEEASQYYKKIIATTDESLGLPQPSQSFIEKFVEEYNKGNVITEVIWDCLHNIEGSFNREKLTKWIKENL